MRVAARYVNDTLPPNIVLVIAPDDAHDKLERPASPELRGFFVFCRPAWGIASRVSFGVFPQKAALEPSMPLTDTFGPYPLYCGDRIESS